MTAASFARLDFLEGGMTLDSILHTSRGQRSMKRSSTAIKMMRKTLASNLSKSQPSTKGAHNRPFGLFCKHKITQRMCGCSAPSTQMHSFSHSLEVSCVAFATDG